MSLTLEIRGSLDDIEADAWNALTTEGNPFVRYEFLHGLEATGCLGADKGWFPRYFLLWQETDQSKDVEDDHGELVAAMPAYVKTHSYGEFVFDWAWAEAYERQNEDYYPKLVCAVPFTPATGPRLLIRADQPFTETANVLATTACRFADEQKFSSVHWLFTRAEDCLALCGTTERALANQTEPDPDNASTEDEAMLLRRMDCQYHWYNSGYSSFDDFLARCNAKRRKTIRRERRYVTDANLTLERRGGESLTTQEWAWVHQFYTSTFDRKWGNPSLTQSFFERMGSSFGESTLIVFAYDPADAEPEKPVACSIMFQGGNCLYGRFWGCRRDYHCLHFEACYYQGIEHCIANGITRFEPGAQGEHKITRGFVPTLTESAHYISHPGFRDAIANYLNQEKIHVRERCTGLTDLLPFKDTMTLTGNNADPVHSS